MSDDSLVKDAFWTGVEAAAAILGFVLTILMVFAAGILVLAIIAFIFTTLSEKEKKSDGEGPASTDS